mgnify:FL=1|tara:strand:+ start:21 stop:419 length:399 start_codon:yes stop_codon:yes gene_type:complete
MDLEILKIASDTNNNKIIKNHTHFSQLKNRLCGDEIQIKLIMKENKIVDFGYQGKSCIYCQASVSLLSKISINNQKNKINELCDDANSYFNGNHKILEEKWKFFKKIFNKKNLSRKECILLPFKTLKKIVSG